MGSGVIVQQHGFMTIQTTFPHCNGQGKSLSKKCTKYNGHGYTSNKETITLNIPAGSCIETHLVARSKDYPGKHGGTNGDAIIIVTLNDKNNNRVDNNFIYYCDVKLSELLCGSTKTIKVCNNDVTFTIPELHNIQQPIIIPGKGFKDLNTSKQRKFNNYVKFTIT